MKKMSVALVTLLLLPAAALAQLAPGNAQNGQMAWGAARLGCRNCHGAQGQGGYAPDLAGRQLSAEQFIRSVRKPWGVMPAFVDAQATDQTLADIAAWMGSLPRTAQADLGTPRFAT